MDSNWQVCGLMVQTRPENVATVTGALNALPGSEVAVSDAATGKLAVVMEAASSRELLNNIESARELAGVLAVSLVYHQQES
ncbi:chaperone NapD [Enterobacteriaceae bacterium BIT-l23]|jgi:nitrate reductase NapD|uniref:chaperone NapD n=1 Tax=Jejubacter sp. L23 TaxID=3092086 RepID=UPI0015854A6A|nr:chaperone NapD [Enterobacteriaceae bacterium BIT-l23]